MVSVTGRISGRDLGSTMREVKRKIGALELPAGTVIEFGGLYGEQQRSFRSLAAVLAGASLLVGLVVLFLYESLRSLLRVAVIGMMAGWFVFVCLYVRGSELDAGSNSSGSRW
jgi:multidrug efflux pump subunit AcrB